MSGRAIWYSAISAGESERARAYSTTSLFEEIEQVGVFEDGFGGGVQLCHQWRHFWGCQEGAFEEGGSELTLQFAFPPAFAQAGAEIKLALFGAFAAAQDEEVVRPGQLSRQR